MYMYIPNSLYVECFSLILCMAEGLVSWKDHNKGGPGSVLGWACKRTLPVDGKSARQYVKPSTSCTHTENCFIFVNLHLIKLQFVLTATFMFCTDAKKKEPAKVSSLDDIKQPQFISSISKCQVDFNSNIFTHIF